MLWWISLFTKSYPYPTLQRRRLPSSVRKTPTNSHRALQNRAELMWQQIFSTHEMANYILYAHDINRKWKAGLYWIFKLFECQSRNDWSINCDNCFKLMASHCYTLIQRKRDGRTNNTFISGSNCINIILLLSSQSHHRWCWIAVVWNVCMCIHVAVQPFSSQILSREQLNLKGIDLIVKMNWSKCRCPYIITRCQT